MAAKKKVSGTLNKDGEWVDSNGKLLPNEVTKNWDKGNNVKYPKHIRDQMNKPKRGRKPKIEEKVTKWDD